MSGTVVPALPAASAGIAALKLLVALGVVLIAFWLFARVLRRFNGGGLSATADLSIIGALSLGQREKLVLVQIGDEQVLVGVTAHAVQAVHVLARPLGDRGRPSGTDDAASATVSSSDRGVDHFRERLRVALGKPVA